MTWGHRGSLLLRCRAFSSLSSCRFIPALSPRHPSDHSTPPTPEGSLAPAPGSQVPSMAFATGMQARLPLGPLARGFLTTPQASLDAADWPVAPRPASTPGSRPTPGPRYRGPWRLPGPDSHRLAAVSLALGYPVAPPFVASAPELLDAHSGGIMVGPDRGREPACGCAAVACEGWSDGDQLADLMVKEVPASPVLLCQGPWEPVSP